jgi:hypothetical protein
VYHVFLFERHNFVAMNIVTKFTVASDAGKETLLMLTKTLANEKFSALLDRAVINHYITTNFNERTLTLEINSLSNQWLVVYVDDNPAGYARITSKGIRPDALSGKRAMRIADFGILAQYDTSAVRDALMDKCLLTCKSYESIWLNEYAGNPWMPFFQSKGFVQQDASQLDELPLTSFFMLKNTGS